MQTDLAVKEPNCLSGGKTEFSEYTFGLLLGLRLHTRMDTADLFMRISVSHVQHTIKLAPSSMCRKP